MVYAVMSPIPFELQPSAFDVSHLPRGFRGYESNAVERLMTTLGSSYEELRFERNELREKLETAQAELSHYREWEQIVTETLASARQAAERMREEAAAKADEILKDAETQAHDIVGGARRERIQTVEETERLRRLSEQTRRELSGFLAKTLEEVAARAPEEASNARDPTGEDTLPGTGTPFTQAS